MTRLEVIMIRCEHMSHYELRWDEPVAAVTEAPAIPVRKDHQIEDAESQGWTRVDDDKFMCRKHSRS